MDDPSTLRKKAARCFENAASLTDEAEKLNEVGRQLAIWADDLEDTPTRRSRSTKRRDEVGAKRSEN